MTTLVIGANGRIGRSVLDQLLAMRVPLRAGVLDVGSAGDLPAGVPVVPADLNKPDTLKAALQGVRNVFVYSFPKGIEDFIDASTNAGVEHIVLLSSGSILLPSAAGNSIAEEHRQVERALTESGVRYTPIRPLVLAHNALSWAHSIRTDNIVRMARPESVTAPIHERDIAAFAVAALTGRAGDGISDLLTGAQLLSHRRQVELIGEALGRPIRVEELSDAQAREQFSRFMPHETAEAIVELIIDADGGGSPATDTAQRVLGRSPISFRQWAIEHSADFR
jgi:uncharacterized protein YbjT (DUF2867 family)